MAHALIWLPEAIDDVDGIAAHIARDSSAYASALVQRIINAAAGLADYPMRGRMVPEWSDESVRETYVGNYRLIYRVDQTSVLVLAVIHGARRLPTSLRDRLAE